MELGSVVVIGEWKRPEEPFGASMFNGGTLSELVRLCVPADYEGRVRIRIEAESLEPEPMKPVNFHYEACSGFTAKMEKSDGKKTDVSASPISS